ncbi:RTA1-like protein [Obba rivulosa]|uniref:RTA1-like protein n=1 Tax=Obba rivulosa TaxID=1052685 RepID=A0A8E2DR31_9APHY|nr:RTA1-like protein [Obba rivulosa]
MSLRRMLQRALTLFSVMSFAMSAAAATPDIDPKDDPMNPLRYIASNALTGVALAAVLLVAIGHVYSFWRYRGKCMLPMVIGDWTYALGFVVRFALHSNPDSKGVYIIFQLLIVLSPCAFIATEYMILGRLARYLDCSRHLLIAPTKIARVFVISDVVTFLIQAGGASLSTAKTESALKAGEHIFLVGLILQLVSFCIFLLIYVRFLLLVWKRDPQLWNADHSKVWYDDWRALAYALLISSIAIFVRCTYRVIELAEGFRGRLSTTEAYFYALDTLPICIAIALYVPFWPGRIIPRIDDDGSRKLANEEYRMDSATALA